MKKGVLLAATAMAVIGAAPLAQAQTAAADTTWQFRCPSAGTTVEQSTGTSLRYRGDAADSPGICVLAGNQRRFLGYWQVSEGFFGAGGRQLAAAFSSGVNLARMRPIEFDYYGMGRTTESIHLRERWSAQPGGSVATPAGTFDTVRVDRYVEIIGSNFNYTQSLWFDRATNAPVTARIDHRNAVQGPTLVNWVAADVSQQRTASR